MMEYAIFSDSNCDIPTEMALEHDIHIIPFYVSLDGMNYLKEGVEITLPEFYKRLRAEDVYPKTSLPSIQDYEDAFQPMLSCGQDILCICMTPKFSGSYQCAMNAAAQAKEKYPERKIIVIDAMQATFGQGIQVLEAAHLRDQGKSIEEVVDAIHWLKKNTRIIFTVDSLEYLQKGGRVGKASALAGSLLNIKPIVYMKDGELLPHSKARGRNKAISKLIDIALNETGDEKDKYEFCVISADCKDEAVALKEVLKKEHGIEITLPIVGVGVTIGAHTGPTALGIVYMKKKFPE